MRGIVGCFAAALLALGCSGARSEPTAGARPDARTLMYLSGIDFWRNGAFIHGAVLWSPSGLQAEGFTFKLMTGTGTYRYVSEGVGAEITGTVGLVSLLPGWRFKRDGLEVTAFAGLDLQHHSLSPDDPGSKVRGFHAGARAGADLWYEPLKDLMLTGSFSVTTVGPGYWARAATGLQLFESVWVGPEALALGDPSYRQWRIGAHATSIRMFDFEWSAGLGFVVDSDDRNGFYARLGVLTRR